MNVMTQVMNVITQMMNVMTQVMMTYDGAGVGANKCSNDSIPARGRPAYSDTRTRHNPWRDDEDDPPGAMIIMKKIIAMGIPLHVLYVIRTLVLA